MSASTLSGTAPAAGSVREKTILIVDDDRSNLELLKMMLERRGYRLITEPDARTALALLGNGARKVDLVITDYRMPVMDGLTLSSEIKRVSPCTPLILITGYYNIDSYLKAADIGIFEYIDQPVIEKELVRIVRAALEDAEAKA